MRINTKIKRKRDIWFAWYPVMVDSDIVWLEKITRTPIYADGFFMYWNYNYYNKDDFTS